MEKIFAIFDSDLFYTTRFIEYCTKQRDIGFDITAFTKRESLDLFLSQHRVEILLLGEGIPKEDIPTEGVGYIYQFTEAKEKEDEAFYIFKYQSAQLIITKIRNNYYRKSNESQVCSNTKTNKIISIFSPRPSSLSISYAWSIGLQLSKLKKVLFVSLELLPVPLLSSVEYSGQSLSEFIYYLKENPNIITKMKDLLNYIDNLAYLSGIMHGADLLAMNKEDIHKWIEELTLHTDYQAIVFYLGYYSDAVTELLKCSDTVLIPNTGLTYDNYLLKEWENQMERSSINIRQDKYQRVLLQDVTWNGTPMSIKELANSYAWEAAREAIKD